MTVTSFEIPAGTAGTTGHEETASQLGGISRPCEMGSAFTKVRESKPVLTDNSGQEIFPDATGNTRATGRTGWTRTLQIMGG